MTDPPYYDEVGYSVVMDFFYVWLRRLTQEYAPALAEAFKEDLSPKWNAERQDGELVDDSARFGGDKAKSKQNYEDGIAKVFHRSCESLGNKGRMLVVFANKDFDAWETLIWWFDFAGVLWLRHRGLSKLKCRTVLAALLHPPCLPPFGSFPGSVRILAHSAGCNGVWSECVKFFLMRVHRLGIGTSFSITLTSALGSGLSLGCVGSGAGGV